MQIAGVAGKELIRPLPGQDALYTLIPGPATDKEEGGGDGGIDRVLIRYDRQHRSQCRLYLFRVY